MLWDNCVTEKDIAKIDGIITSNPFSTSLFNGLYFDVLLTLRCLANNVGTKQFDSL